jgi:hypothetical protein
MSQDIDDSVLLFILVGIGLFLFFVFKDTTGKKEVPPGGNDETTSSPDK